MALIWASTGTVWVVPVTLRPDEFEVGHDARFHRIGHHGEQDRNVGEVTDRVRLVVGANHAESQRGAPGVDQVGFELFGFGDQRRDSRRVLTGIANDEIEGQGALLDVGLESGFHFGFAAPEQHQDAVAAVKEGRLQQPSRAIRSRSRPPAAGTVKSASAVAGGIGDGAWADTGTV
jgi:hypothetical protein